jgi:DNA polymerase-3 subunit delta'
MVGNKSQQEGLRRALAKERGHAFILHGPAGIGKATLIRSISKELLQSDRLDNHPDYFEIGPDTEKERPSIGIDAIRDARQFLRLRSATGSGKVLFIETADAMTAGASNALLKSLEEPPIDTRIFLSAEHTNRVLPTIRSRTLAVRFQLLKDSEIRAFLVDLGADKKSAEEIAKLAHGRAGYAHTLFTDSVLRSAMQRRESAAVQLVNAPLITRLAYSAKAENTAPEAIRELPAQWLPALRDIVRKGDVHARVLSHNLFQAIQILDASNVRPELVLDAALIEGTENNE